VKVILLPRINVRMSDAVVTRRESVGRKSELRSAIPNGQDAEMKVKPIANFTLLPRRNAWLPDVVRSILSLDVVGILSLLSQRTSANRYS
jgi:hypothetical protein